MSSEDEAVLEQALRRVGSWDGEGRAAEATRAVIGELFEMLDEPEPPARMRRAEALGSVWHQLGRSASEAARDVSELGRQIEEALAERGRLSIGTMRRLAALVSRAITSAVDEHAAAARERRDVWLSFYTHELRNPLNTIVNALWILRNQTSTPQGQRVCDMADRAVQKMEGLIHDVRAMERTSHEEPPRRPKLG